MGRRLMVTAASGKLPAAQSVNFERVYHELRAIARRFFEGEREGHTLTSTSLVHEAWRRVEKTSELSEADGQRQVRAIMATVMRHILVEHARRRRRRIQILKGAAGPIFRVAAEEAVQGTVKGSVDLIDLLDLDHALLRLSEEF